MDLRVSVAITIVLKGRLPSAEKYPGCVFHGSVWMIHGNAALSVL